MEEKNTKEELMSMEEALEAVAKMDKTGLNKPTQEEIDAAAAEFQAAVEKFNSTEYEIGTAETAEDLFKFFEDYLNNFVFWTKNGWMGVIRLNDELAQQKLDRKDDDPLKLSYQALEFVNFMLANPGGQGLNSAKAIETIAEMYIFVMEEVGGKLEAARATLKDIQFLQDKQNAMAQGFYLEREDGVAKEDECDGEDCAEDCCASPEAE